MGTRSISIIGAHASITPSILSGIEYMHSLGANAIQIFAGSSQSSSLKTKQQVSPDQASSIRNYIQRNNIKVVIHAIYTINLCAHPATSGKIKYAQDNIIYDMELAEKIGASGVIIHLGSALALNNNQDASTNLVSNIIRILARTSRTAPSVFLALETPAGQGKQIASSLDELGQVWKQCLDALPASISKRRLGVCIDTAHIFSAGEDIRNPDKFQEYINSFDKLIGIKNIKCFHLNDSRAGLNAHRDIHEGLGAGYIFSQKHNPEYQFATINKLIQLAKKYHIPVILETHRAGSLDNPDSQYYAQEIAFLRQLATTARIPPGWKLINPGSGITFSKQAKTKRRPLSSFSSIRIKSKKALIPNNLYPAATTRPSLNGGLLDKLKLIQDYYNNIERDTFRALAYGKAILAIRKYPAVIMSSTQVAGLAGIGKSILAKIDEYCETGTIKILETESVLDKLESWKLSQKNNIENVLGFGPKKVKLLAKKGIRTLDQLQQAYKKGLLELTDQEVMGLKYHADLIKPVPRADAEAIFKQIVQALDNAGLISKYGLKVELAGSYPSGKEFSKDIDILIFTRKYPDPDSPLPAIIMNDISSRLKESKILVDTINQGSGKIMGIAQTQASANVPVRHIDIRLLPAGAEVFGRFYFTSGRVFNQMVRAHAKSQGYKLNEFGLYDLRKKTNARVSGLDSEEKIMEHIGLAFIPMSKRRT